MTPVTVPLAVKLVMGLAVLWWVNGVAPEIARAVLLLLVLYLVSANAGKAGDLLAGPVRALSNLFSPAPMAAPPALRPRPF